MSKQVLPVDSTEPIRKIANWAAGIIATLVTVLVVVNQLVDFLPEAQRGKASAVLAAIGVVLTGGAKVAGELGRARVYSPATHDSDVAVAQSAALRKP